MATIQDVRDAHRVQYRTRVTVGAGSDPARLYPLQEPTPAGSGAGQVPTSLLSDFPALPSDAVIMRQSYSGRVRWGLTDLVWVGPSISTTGTGTTTLGSVAFPARDVNGSSNGEGYQIGLVFSTSTVTASSSISLSYTNSANTSGRTATVLGSTVPAAWPSQMPTVTLEGSDKGVKSVESLTVTSGTGASGVCIPIVYRPLYMTWSHYSTASTPISLYPNPQRRSIFPARLLEGTLLMPVYLYDTGPSSRTHQIVLDLALV